MVYIDENFEDQHNRKPTLYRPITRKLPVASGHDMLRHSRMHRTPYQLRDSSTIIDKIEEIAVKVRKNNFGSKSSHGSVPISRDKGGAPLILVVQT